MNWREALDELSDGLAGAPVTAHIVLLTATGERIAPEWPELWNGAVMSPDVRMVILQATHDGDDPRWFTFVTELIKVKLPLAVRRKLCEHLLSVVQRAHEGIATAPEVVKRLREDLAKRTANNVGTSYLLERALADMLEGFAVRPHETVVALLAQKEVAQIALKVFPTPTEDDVIAAAVTRRLGTALDAPIDLSGPINATGLMTRPVQ